MEQALFLLVGAAIAGVMVYLSMRRGITDLASARAEQTDLSARHDEAKARVTALEAQLSVEREKFEKAITEKAEAQRDAAQAQELRNTLSEKNQELKEFQLTVTKLEKEKTEAIERAEAANLRANERIETELKRHREVLQATEEKFASQKEFIEKAREVLSDEFKLLSNETLKDVSEQLVKTADGLIEKHSKETTKEVELREEKIKGMLKPVEETIKRLDKHVETSNEKRQEAEVRLDEQVKRLAGASENLTNALKKPVIRGSWGENMLENALESAGLVEGIDYVLQHTTTDEENVRRTDAVISLPKGKKLVIDSKNLWVSYEACVNPENPDDIPKMEDAHSKAFRSHLRSLSGKEYWKRYEGLDCVILFIPHEGMYHTAIKNENDLIREMNERRVYTANPMTLMPLLMAVRHILDQEQQNKSAEAIKKVGMDLYSDITKFASKMATVGNHLKRTVAAYNASVPALDRYILAKSRSLNKVRAIKGSDPELPELIEIEPIPFSRELAAVNEMLELDENLFEEEETDSFPSVL